MVNDDRALHSSHLDTEQGRLHVYHAGGDGPPVLLLSGSGVDNAMLSWRHLIPALAARHRVLALDWPRQGLSRPWHGIADHAVMLRCVIDTLDDFESIVDEVVRGVGAGSSDWQNASIGLCRMKVDLRPRLHEITAPTLFIQGDRDIGVRPRHTRAAARLVPKARIEVLEEATATGATDSHPNASTRWWRASSPRGPLRR